MIEKSHYSEILEPFEIGAVQQGNYTSFDLQGFRQCFGDAISHRDEYPSHPWIAAGAQASPDLTNHTIGGVARRIYAFNGATTEERLSSSFEIPHDYAYGQPIEVHAHFRPSTTGSGDVKFFFDWEHSPAQGAPASQTTMTLVHTINADEQYYHLIKSFGDLPDLGFRLGDKIGFNIRRTPTDAADTYAADVLLEQVALHVPIDSDGSKQRYAKL